VTDKAPAAALFTPKHLDFVSSVGKFQFNSQYYFMVPDLGSITGPVAAETIVTRVTVALGPRPGACRATEPAWRHWFVHHPDVCLLAPFCSWAGVDPFTSTLIPTITIGGNTVPVMEQSTEGGLGYNPIGPHGDWEIIFRADNQGRDVMARLLYGAYIAFDCRGGNVAPYAQHCWALLPDIWWLTDIILSHFRRLWAFGYLWPFLSIVLIPRPGAGPLPLNQELVAAHFHYWHRL
jgi:hypothetical protein